MIACACCDDGIFPTVIDIVEVCLLSATAVFAFLAVAVAHSNSVADRQIELLPARGKIIDVICAFATAFGHGLMRIKAVAQDERTCFYLGQEWFSSLIKDSSYLHVAALLGYDATKEDAPYTVYSKGQVEFGELAKQVRYLFSLEVNRTVDGLLKLFAECGYAVSHPELGSKMFSESEIGNLENYARQLDDACKRMVEESRPFSRVKPFTWNMLKELLGR